MNKSRPLGNPAAIRQNLEDNLSSFEYILNPHPATFSGNITHKINQGMALQKAVKCSNFLVMPGKWNNAPLHLNINHFKRVLGG